MYTNHVLICGAPRSGTTALANALHRRYPLITNELSTYRHLIAAETRSMALVRTASTSVRRWGFHILGTPEGLTSDELFFEAVYKELDEHMEAADLNFFEDVSTAYETTRVSSSSNCDHNTTFVGDKDPIYTTMIPQLAARYAGINVLYIERDGREVAGSLLRLGWAKTVEEAFNTWLTNVSAWHSTKHLVRHLEIKQSDLMLHWDRVAKQVNEFLGMDVPEDYFTDFIMKKSPHDKGGLGLDAHNWQNYYTEADIPMEAMDKLVEFGYC